ncbi:MAG: hypothetical protein QG581_450 [Patescibacteria group bacterium]|nr:hypothetical protein [Patescibacteria group bacterium]
MARPDRVMGALADEGESPRQMLVEEFFYRLDFGEKPVGEIPVGEGAIATRRAVGGQTGVENRDANHYRNCTVELAGKLPVSHAGDTLLVHEILLGLWW